MSERDENSYGPHALTHIPCKKYSDFFEFTVRPVKKSKLFFEILLLFHLLILFEFIVHLVEKNELLFYFFRLYFIFLNLLFTSQRVRSEGAHV